MRPLQHRQSSRLDKGKTREIGEHGNTTFSLSHYLSFTHHTDLLTQLNKLLEQLLIPISLPDLTVATPSLLLAVVESILKRRFLALNDPTRTSRSAHCRSKCLKITMKVLAQSLDTNLDRWSPDAINLPGLVQGETSELPKLINGILKLSTLPHNPLINNPKDNRHQDLSPKQRNGCNSNDPVLKQHEYATDCIPATQVPRSSRISSLNSSSSSLSVEPSKIPFDGLFSPVGPPLEPSLNLPSRRSSSTNSSNAALSLSLNSQKMYDDPLSGQTSNPPTLRNLLGPLHAQMISSKRPHTPRTAHRVMVNKLRNEGIQDNSGEQILNHDTDGWMTARTEAEDDNETSVEESRYQYTKGIGLMTLDGIEPDDPFVSMETRRALESQIMQNQANISFDLTRLAVAGSESYNKTIQSSRDPRSPSSPPQRKPGSELPANPWSTSCSSALSNFSLKSSQPASEPNDFLTQCYQGHRHYHHHHHQQQHHDDQSSEQSIQSSPRVREPIDRNFSSPDFIESSFGDKDLINRSDCGFGRPTDSIQVGSRDHSCHHPYPSSIPLPASPTQSNICSAQPRKVLLASDGVKLDLVVSDVMAYEQKKTEHVNIQGWDWIDLTKMAEESEGLQQSGPAVNAKGVKADPHANLLSRKLELLRLLNQAYSHNKRNDRSDQQSPESTEAEEDKLHTRTTAEQKENVRIRVNRQPLEATTINHPGGHTNGFIVLSKSHYVHYPDHSSTAHPSGSRDFSFDYNDTHLDHGECFDERDDLIDDVI
ncbi:hypothetical protein VP01_2232g3 [Puccinia sorghi]|uniref:Uncharacterized protein n=1 Tax=Puccinia sorghi TaxID=27349 RepID=A0A0L6VAI4_9BASI|nr:hypothetical protein VP01_2232g3 [Puccinia sorghi]